RPDLAGLERCEAAVAQLEADPTVPISEIADRAGVSHAHLDREFGRIVGLTPRILARDLRMRRLLESVDAHGATQWAVVAAELGWADQPHLIRDFKRHTGVTPTDYLARQRRFEPHPEPGEVAGFVPDHEPRRGTTPDRD
ncbi:MAG: helix-turn-helix transcriptional regulator, partial [Ilumatobacter sp.]